MRFRVLFLLSLAAAAWGQQPLHVAVAGLVHGHVDGFFRLVQKHPEVQIVGVFEPSEELRKQYAEKFQIPQKAFFADLTRMLAETKPDAVATFTNTFDHAPPPLPAEERDSLAYLAAVVHGMKPSGVSGLDNNMIVTEILDAARESIRTGKKVSLR